MSIKRVAVVRSDKFEHRAVQSHFTNPCCFGEDFALWLKARLSDLPEFIFSEPVQEDFGWGLEARRKRETYWIGISYVGNGPTESPGEWVISVANEGNLIRRMFDASDLAGLIFLGAQILKVLECTPEVEILRDCLKSPSFCGIS